MSKAVRVYYGKVSYYFVHLLVHTELSTKLLNEIIFILLVQYYFIFRISTDNICKTKKKSRDKVFG